MKVVKKFTALLLDSKTVDNSLEVQLSHGIYSGPYYDRSSPEQEFDTEKEAFEYAFKESSYGTWLILPITRFDNYE